MKAYKLQEEGMDTVDANSLPGTSGQTSVIMVWVPRFFVR